MLEAGREGGGGRDLVRWTWRGRGGGATSSKPGLDPIKKHIPCRLSRHGQRHVEGEGVGGGEGLGRAKRMRRTNRRCPWGSLDGAR